MNPLKNIAGLFLLLLNLTGNCQVIFYQLPKDLQLFPRQEDSYGRFTITGSCTEPDGGYLETKIINAADSGIISQDKIEIFHNQVFEIPVKLKAQLVEYDLKIWFIARTGSRYLAANVHNLVAGDIFLAGGQSNAGAPIFDGGSFRELDSLYSHKCCRTVGHDFSIGVKKHLSVEYDSRFLRPSSGVWDDLSRGFVGVWVLKLQSELAMKTGIPNCIINSSQGATPISMHLSEKTPTDGVEILNGKDSIYGPARLYERLFMKTFVNNISHSVKGIFWYQGESDAAFPYNVSANYKNSFANLYRSWKADYPGVLRVFVLQVNTGCGEGNLALVRDQQMKFSDQFTDVTVMTTVGGSPEQRAEDGCHFKPAGYLRVSDILMPVVLKYIYHHQVEEMEFLPPRLARAFYESETKLCLLFDKKVIVQDSLVYSTIQNKVAYLKDYFYDANDATLPLKGISANGDSVFLHLTAIGKKIENISYLPAAFAKVPAVYDGPWILNYNKKVGAFPIYKFPVSDGVLTNEPYIFPNPADAEFRVHFLLGNKITHIVVYDEFGSARYDSGQIESEDHRIICNFPDGMYTVKVTHPGGTVIKKLIITKGD